MTVNEKQGVCYPQPKTFEQRLTIARDFVARFGYDLPLLVDGMDNAADQLYAAWPERLYVVDEHGKLVYKGRLGPFGFEPEEVATWLAQHVGPPKPG